MNPESVINLSTAREIPDAIADKFDDLNRRHAAIMETQKLALEQVMAVTKAQIEELTKDSDAVWAEMVETLGLEQGQQYSVTAGHRPAYVVNAQELMAAQAQAQAEAVAATSNAIDQ